MIIPQSFYNKKTQAVAQNLLGCFLVRKIGDKIIKAMIIETEAYDGPHDLASHASRGRTPRNEPMFGRAGIIYVYLIYGMHYMLNIVTGPKNYPAAVLIRGARTDNNKLNLNGPARLTKVLQIDKNFNNSLVYLKKTELWIEGRKNKIKQVQIKKAPRVGVDYAKEYKDKKWRFILK